MANTGTTRTAAQILVDALKIHGVDTAFCVPGESYLAVLDALYDARDSIRLIVARQDGGAAYMAEAWAKVTGRPGICFVTRGPGATNASIGVHTAQQDSTPMILFIGQVPGEFSDRESFQEMDYRHMFGPMAKWVAQIDRPERMHEYVSHAFHLVRRDVGDGGGLGEHVLGKREHHRARPAGHGEMEGVTHVLVHALGAVDLRDPLRHRPEHVAVVHLLERFAVGEFARHLADEKDHRSGVLLRGVHADRSVGRSGPSRDEADPRAPGDLGPGLGHVRGAAVLARDDQAYGIARVVERVENGEIALAGYAECGIDAVDFQRIDEDLGRGPRCAGVGHCWTVREKPQLYRSDAAPVPIG